MNPKSATLPRAGFHGIARGQVAIPFWVVVCFSLFELRAEISPADLVFFESKVRPLLVGRCLECHGEKKQKGGLRLDSRSGWEQGGEKGRALVPGKPEESLIVRGITGRDPDFQMPPKDKLPESEVETLVEWIRRGAPDPREQVIAKGATGMTLEEGRRHWAFQPIANPPPPAVKQLGWPRGAIDRFILARLEAEGLQPAPDADRHTWLRRVTFDLTGLPPTIEEIASFVEDASPRAKEAVVDRLLASVAFGERWARHWLDLVGYADQLGTVNDVPAPHAWRYRDYVVRAFNQDKPFDRFIREQIAGDLLTSTTPEARQEALTATGFLLLGEIHIVTSDKSQLRADIVDHQIQKVGAAFLGQTLGCVRCHDHKFDPIHLQDYYGLAGIFGSTESAYVTDRGVWSSILSGEIPESADQLANRAKAMHDHSETVSRIKAEKEALNEQLAEVKRSIDQAAKAVGTAPAVPEAKAGPAGGAPPSAAAGKEAQSPDLKGRQAELEKQIASLGSRLLHLAYIEPKAAFAHCVRDSATPADGRVTLRGNVRALGAAVPRGFVRVVSDAPWPSIPKPASGRVELADWLVRQDNPLPARVTANRIWQKLFGEGLVRTVDYFGTRGDRPSHPELLDWLASEFLRGGWSQKKLIRQVVLSRTYGMSSARQSAGDARDPDNRLLSRMNRRRLDAEALRDAVLAVSRELLHSPGGPALALHLPENVGGLDPKDVNPISFRTSKFPPEQHRHRTIYLPVVRSREQPGPAELRNLFDFVPPTEMAGQRPATSVATQALFLMNSEFMKSHAGKLAEWIRKEEFENNRRRLEALYLLALNRTISEAEAREAERFLEMDTGADEVKTRASWTALCHAMLSSNEFLFRL